MRPSHALAAGGAAALALGALVWWARRAMQIPRIDGPLEGYAPLEPVTSCDPQARPGVIAFRDYVIAHFGGADWGIVRPCSSAGPTSRHNEGRAWDWAPPDAAAADAFLEWLFGTDPATGEAHGMLRRAGVRTVIWARKIWTGGGPWKPYKGASPHTDHVHVDFSWAGARGETSFYAAPWVAEVSLEEGDRPTVDEGPPRCVELAAVRGLEGTSDGFRRRLVKVAAEHGLDPSALAAVISFETAGTFRPDIRAGGKADGAVGLIQFTTTAASSVGTTKARLAAMSAEDQLEYVGKYFGRVIAWKGPIRSTCDHYLAVFAPAHVGAGDLEGLYVAPSESYAANAALDANRDGVITAAEACRHVLGLLSAAKNRPPILVSVSPSLAERLFTGAALAGTLGLAALTVSQW